MKNKIIQFIPAIIALLVIVFRYFSNWCIDSALFCYGTWIHQNALTVIKPLYFFAIFSLPIAIILVFVPQKVFKSWLKFAAWALPILFILIATQPVVSNMFSTDRNDAARLAGVLFSAISFLIILWKIYRHRKSIY